MDWFDLVVQGTLKSLLQHHNSKHQFFGAQPSLWSNSYISIHDYWKKKHSFDIQTFVSKVKSLIFNVLSMLVIAFLPRGKHLLISWLQSLSTVILEPKKIKCHCFPICATK